jgi:hypothetical protein
VGLLMASAPTERVMTFRNLCTEPVWIGFAGGSVRNRNSPSDTRCGGDGDCYQGSRCIQTGAINQCFFQNPSPADKQFKLDEGQSKDVSIPIYNNGLDIIWSGAITGKTGCDANGQNCKKADCGTDGTGNCRASQGFQQPATQAEMTLAKTFVDFYDIEIINGVHMGVSMEPTNIQTKADNPYICGAPGSKFPKDSRFSSCSWSFNPPSNDYRWVTAGGVHCQADSECQNGTLCGLSFNPGHADLLQKTCGDLLGYWSADQVCGLIPSFGAPFNCQSGLPAPNAGLTNWNLYACVGVGSCYASSAESSCCGCANWDEEGLQVPPAPDTKPCISKNPNWNDRVKQTLKWLKEACPTAYTYPYDDVTSTFTCQNLVEGVSNVNYRITFCPENDKPVIVE